MEATGWPPERWAILGDAIAKARRAKGWDQQELANKSGNSATTISNYERGRASRSRRVPGGYLRVANALGWIPDAPKLILSGEEPEHVLSQKSLFEDDTLASNQEFHLGSSVPENMSRLSAREAELTHSGFLAQDVFMRQEKRYRKMKDVSVEQIVERVRNHGSSLSTNDLERLENGTRLLRMKEAQALAEALDTTVDWLLGSAFSHDAPEELRWPPNAEELEAEAKAVQRRLGDLGGQVIAARHRERQAHHDYLMASDAAATAAAHEREMERHYQYLLGRIDSLRSIAGQQTIIETVPVFEGDDTRARNDDLEDPPL